MAITVTFIKKKNVMSQIVSTNYGVSNFYNSLCVCFLTQVEEGWWEGTLNGKTGMFPSNFTKELLAEAEDLTPQDDTRSTRTSQSLHHILS